MPVPCSSHTSFWGDLRFFVFCNESLGDTIAGNSETQWVSLLHYKISLKATDCQKWHFKTNKSQFTHTHTHTNSPNTSFNDHGSCAKKMHKGSWVFKRHVTKILFLTRSQYPRPHSYTIRKPSVLGTDGRQQPLCLSEREGRRILDKEGPWIWALKPRGKREGHSHQRDCLPAQEPQGPAGGHVWSGQGRSEGT